MVGTQQFNLRWNNHTTNILQVFLEHLSSESLVDVTLSSEGKFVRAHKIILSACSLYFQEVFANHTDKNPLIILNGIKFEDLEGIIKFMYNGEIKVQEEQLESLLAAAETLQVKGLSNVRSKYEKGEITTSSPLPAQKIVKTSEAPPPTKESPPVHSLKATVALFSPTMTTTGAPNSKTQTIDIAASAPSSVPRTKTSSAKAPAVITSNVSNRTVSIAPKPAATPVPALAIATIMPTTPNAQDAKPAPLARAGGGRVPRSTPKILPRIGNVHNIRNVVPILPRPATSKSSTKSSTSLLTLSAISGITSGSTSMNSSVIPITFTTPSMNLMKNPSSVDDIKVKTADVINIMNKKKDTGGNTHFLRTLLKTNSDSLTEMNRVQSSDNEQPEDNTITKVNKEAKKKSDVEEPRVRKRRKTSHIVNELASEAVFASNGTVLLEPDDSVLKRLDKNSILPTNFSDNAEIEDITMPGESKNIMVKIQSKHPQESLLIKDKDKKESTKIPRPPNAFMMFANEWRKKIAVEYPNESNTSISVKLGIMWKGLSLKSKETYYRLAKKADEEHKLKYPDYFYSPKEARIRKILKHGQSKHSHRSSKFTSDGQNPDEVEITETYMKDEGITQKEEPFTSESEDDDDYTYEEVEEDYELEEEDDVILEYSADEEEDVKPDLSILEANIAQSTTLPS